VVIIGAARSGTNILRDTLVRLPGHGTWPCDEINLIWRHGNTREPTDELPPALATPSVQRSVRGAFDAIAAHRHLRTVVEKTCANSLRVAFVDRIVPTARYVFIVRDGRDVVASAMRRWSAPLDLRYTLRKARYAPLDDVPRYAAGFIANRLHARRSPEARVASWGPRFEGMDAMLRTSSLAEVCATQWARSVQHAARDLESIGSDRVVRVRYEDLTADPASEIDRIAAFLGVEPDDEVYAGAASITAASVGNWQRSLGEAEKRAIAPIVEPVMERNDLGR
jgi:hypothetical protein